MARSYYSTVFEQSADDVWTALRDFNGLATWWSSTVSASEIEGGRPADSIGCVRSFALGDGRIREQLVALDDLARSYSYVFCEPAPFPVLDYVSTVRVTPITGDGRAFVEWWTTFECDRAELDHWRRFFAAEVFAPALEGLRSHLAG